MKQEKLNSSIEVFICNHHRDDDQSCAQRGGKELTDQLKKWAKEETNKEIKVFRSGCLGKCADGIAIACFPSKKFLLHVAVEDVDEIKKGLNEALAELKV
jgi:predicted metal-binding protein